VSAFSGQFRLADGGSTSLLCESLPGWSRDFHCPLSAAGALAAYTPSTGPTWSVRVVSLTGGASFTVTALAYSIHFDGDGRLVFFDADGFLSAALPSGEVRQIGHPVIDGYPDTVSPDGKWRSFLAQDLEGPCVNCWRLQLLSTVTATTWTLTSAGTPLFIFAHEFSPDSSSVLLLTPDRNLAVVPVEGGAPRLIQTDVDGASWAGPNHIVMTRTRSSPAGVQILKVR